MHGRTVYALIRALDSAGLRIPNTFKKTTPELIYGHLYRAIRSEGFGYAVHTRYGMIEDARVEIEGLRNQFGLVIARQVSNELDAAVAAADTVIERILATRSAAQAAAAQAAAADEVLFAGVGDVVEDDDAGVFGGRCIVS